MTRCAHTWSQEFKVVIRSRMHGLQICTNCAKTTLRCLARRRVDPDALEVQRTGESTCRQPLTV
jgi:hypothetical protein